MAENSNKTPHRRGPGRPFEPGKSGNPGGRPKGAAAMAQKIREETRDGAALVEFALEVFRNKAPGGKGKGAKTKPYSLDDQKWAHQWLSDRGFGKALQSIELDDKRDDRKPTSAGTRGELAELLREAQASRPLSTPDTVTPTPGVTAHGSEDPTDPSEE